MRADDMEKKTRAPDWGSAYFNTAKLGRAEVSRTSRNTQAGSDVVAEGVSVSSTSG